MIDVVDEVLPIGGDGGGLELIGVYPEQMRPSSPSDLNASDMSSSQDDSDRDGEQSLNTKLHVLPSTI